jgi:hypothetical protein
MLTLKQFKGLAALGRHCIAHLQWRSFGFSSISRPVIVARDECVTSDVVKADSTRISFVRYQSHGKEYHS